MKFVIVGGTGLIGSQVVTLLNQQGHDTVPASPSRGIDSVTGAGVDEALSGADVVVDVSNSPSFADKDVMDFFIASTHNLTSSAKRAGVAHYVALSVVGNAHIDGGYMKAKAAQEKILVEAGIPYSIVRATQFFEFSNSMADSMTVGEEVRVAPVAFQPIAAVDVAAFVERAAVSAPLNGALDVGGPEVFRFDEFFRSLLASRDDPRSVTTDPAAPYFGAAMQETSLIPEANAPRGSQTFDEWLASSR